MENFGIFHGHMVYFEVILFNCALVYFSRFGSLYLGKSGNPCARATGPIRVHIVVPLLAWVCRTKVPRLSESLFPSRGS
jgi:hypothetical protein